MLSVIAIDEAIVTKMLVALQKCGNALVGGSGTVHCALCTGGLLRQCKYHFRWLFQRTALAISLSPGPQPQSSTCQTTSAESP